MSGVPSLHEKLAKVLQLDIQLFVRNSHKFLSCGSSAGNPRNSNTCFSVSNFKLALPLVCAVDAELHQHENEEKKKGQSETYVTVTKANYIPVFHPNYE